MKHSEVSPYVGSKAYAEVETPLFAGRSREIERLFWMVLAYPDVLMLARSGLGKTSLVRAGLIPMLQDEGHQVLPVVSLSPAAGGAAQNATENPFMMGALATWGIEAEQVRGGTKRSLSRHLGNLKRARTPDGEARLRICIFDQLEVMFLSTVRRSWSQDFFRQAQQLIEEDPLIRLLLVLREDYLAPAERYASLLPNRLRVQLRLEGLDRGSALRAIKEPSGKFGYVWDDGTAETLVDELASEAGFIEPAQLQLVCSWIWEATRKSGTEAVSSSLLRGLGGVSGVLDHVFEQAIGETSVPSSDVRSWISKFLVSPRGTRVTIPSEPKETRGLPNEVLDALVDARLVRRELREGEQWLEIAHDSLVGFLRR